MTKISYIHGPVPTDEYKDRAGEVKPAPYFNPLVLTEGGAYLRLMRDQVSVLSQYYPESKVYRKGLAMIDNQLHAGLNGPAVYMGAVDRALYPVARAIDIYKTRREPATTVQVGVNGSWQDESMVAGPLPSVTQEFALWWWMQDMPYLKSLKIGSAQALKNILQDMKAPPLVPRNEFEKKWTTFSQKYDNLKFVTDLYNEKIEKFAHHPLYNFLPQSTRDYPAAVVTKNILHSAGVQAMANQGDFSTDNMSLWTRNSILRANIAGGVGAFSPERSIFELTKLPEAELGKFLNISTGSGADKTRGGVQGDHIGVVPFVALIPLIVAAVTVAGGIVQSIIQSKNQQNAFASVQGWGTQAYSATDQDWKNFQLQQGAGATQASEPNWPLIIGGGAAAAWLLTSK